MYTAPRCQASRRVSARSPLGGAIHITLHIFFWTSVPPTRASLNSLSAAACSVGLPARDRSSLISRFRSRSFVLYLRMLPPFFASAALRVVFSLDCWPRHCPISHRSDCVSAVGLHARGGRGVAAGGAGGEGRGREEGRCV